MVEKVTKEERMATLLKEAAEKAIEILNANDFNEDDLSGEDVKVTKPKAEKVSDAKGSDSQKAHVRDAVGSDGNQVMKSKWGKSPTERCDSFPDCKNDAAMFSTINCMKVCQECYDAYMDKPVYRIKPDKTHEEMKRPMVGWKPFTVKEYRQHCEVDPRPMHEPSYA